MAWGDAGVSKRQLISNGAVAWGVGGTPVRSDIPQTGILRQLKVLHASGALTATAGTGAITLDVQGPWNIYSRFLLTPNSQAPIVNVSGFGLSLINQLIMREMMGNTPDTTIVSPVAGEAATDVYNASVTSTTSGGNPFYQYIPVAQTIRSLGGEVGLFPLQNPAVQLQLFWTPNSGSSASAYNIYSTTATNSPYLVTNNATVTLATPTLEVVRDLWEVPADQANYPPFNFVSSWSEETFQTSVVGATQLNWKATPLSGILVRVIGYILDGATLAGALTSTLTASNAVNLTYGAGTAKFAETGNAAAARMQAELGHMFAKGGFYYDLLGPNLTLQDSLNLFKIGNVQLQFNLTAALASSSAGKVLRQTIMPLVVQ